MVALADLSDRPSALVAEAHWVDDDLLPEISHMVKRVEKTVLNNEAMHCAQ